MTQSSKFLLISIVIYSLKDVQWGEINTTSSHFPKYQSENNLNEAKNAFEKSLTLYSDYLPAKNALNQIDKQINEIKIDGSDMNDEI